MKIAQFPINNPVGPFPDMDSGVLISNTVPWLITLLLVIGAVIFLFVFILGGIQWIASAGDKQGVEMAKSKVQNAVIGLILLFSVFAVIVLLSTFFGIDLTTFDLDKLKLLAPDGGPPPTCPPIGPC